LLRNSPKERISQRKYEEITLTSHDESKGKTKRRAEEESQALQLIYLKMEVKLKEGK
jgi:hypothetical protein